jgi:hypothetical protein
MVATEWAMWVSVKDGFLTIPRSSARVPVSSTSAHRVFAGLISASPAARTALPRPLWAITLGSSMPHGLRLPSDQAAKDCAAGRFDRIFVHDRLPTLDRLLVRLNANKPKLVTMIAHRSNLDANRWSRCGR